MLRIHQTIFEPPNGNCLAACVASLLEVDLDQVPNFAELDARRRDPAGAWEVVDGDGQEWWRVLGETATDHGFSLVQLACDRAGKPGGWGALIDAYALAIATVESPRGDWMHCVVASLATGKVVHDPYPAGWSHGYQLTDDMLHDWLLLVEMPTTRRRKR